MAMRGEYIGFGYVKGRGNVRIYQDLDNPAFLFVRNVKSDSQAYVARERVEFRKEPKKT